MSGLTQVYRPAGPTIALSVVATSHAAVPITLTTNDTATFLALLNLGSVAVAVKVGVAGAAAVLPIDGTSTGDFVLPPLMVTPMTIALPTAAQGLPCQLTAIGATLGPSIIYATPVVMQ